MPDPLYRVIRDVQIRHLRTAWMSSSWRAALWGFTAAAVTGAVMRAFGGRAVYVTAVVTAIVAAFVYVVMRKPRKLTPVEAARLADARLNLKDRLATAVEWEGHPSIMAERLQEDARHHAQRQPWTSVVSPFAFFHPSHRALIVAALCTSFLWFVPIGPADAITDDPGPSSADNTWTSMPGEDDWRYLHSEAASLTGEERDRFQRHLQQLEEGVQDGSIPPAEAETLLDFLHNQLQRHASAATATPTIDTVARRNNQPPVAPLSHHDDGVPPLPTAVDQTGDGVAFPSGFSDVSPDMPLVVANDDAADDGIDDNDQADRPDPSSTEATTGDRQVVENAPNVPDERGSPEAGDAGGAPLGGALEGFDPPQFEGRSLSAPGTHAGGDDAEQPYEPQGMLDPHRLPGVPADDGAVRPGTIQADLARFDEPLAGQTPASAVADNDHPDASPRGVMRRSIPLAFRDWLQHYFSGIDH